MSHVYVRALAIGCFYSHISTRTRLEGASRVAGQLRGDNECPFSGVTKPGRIWRKVPESGAWSVSALVSCSMLILCGLYEWTVCEAGQDGI